MRGHGRDLACGLPGPGVVVHQRRRQRCALCVADKQGRRGAIHAQRADARQGYPGLQLCQHGFQCRPPRCRVLLDRAAAALRGWQRHAGFRHDALPGVYHEAAAARGPEINAEVERHGSISPPGFAMLHPGYTTYISKLRGIIKAGVREWQVPSRAGDAPPPRRCRCRRGR